MKFIDLKDNDTFIFSDSDGSPYVKIYDSYFNSFTGELIPWKDVVNDPDIIKVDRGVLWKKGYAYEIPQYVIEDRIKELLRLYAPKNEDILSRTEYIFSCLNCKKSKRRSIHKTKAEDGLCKKCRINEKTGMEQPSLFL